MFVIADSTDTVDMGSAQGRYLQKYKNYPVENKMMNVFSKCNVVLGVSGSVLTGLDIDVSSPINEEDALDSAMKYLNADGYYWQITNWENGLKETMGNDSAGWDSTATWKPVGELIIAKKFGEDFDDITANYALCWKFGIHSIDTITNSPIDTVTQYSLVYVNALDGTIHTAYDPATGAFYTLGDVNAWYHGQRNNAIWTETCGLCSRYKLKDFVTTGNHNESGVLCFDNNDMAKPVTDGDNHWDGTPAQAYWGVEQGRYYFALKHGFNTNNITSVVFNVGGSISNIVQWIPEQRNEIIKVSTDIGAPYNSAASLDVVMHEYTHAMIHRSSKLSPYSGEPGVLNQGFCDIFGLLGAAWTLNNSTDWSWGDEVGKSHSFDNPTSDYPASAAVYGGTNWNGDVYAKAGVIRRWFYLLSQGNGSFPGVGIDIAENITFITMTWWLWERADIAFCREQSLLVAAKYYGGVCSPVWQAVANAWHEVGVGNLPLCKPFHFRTPYVLSLSQVGSVNPVRLQVGTTNDAATVIGYDWDIPSGWNGTYNTDHSELTLDYVPNGNSKRISVIVTYEESSTTYYDTLSTVLHFCDDCLDSTIAKPSNNAITQFSGIDKNGKPLVATEDEVRVYPNPASNYVNIIIPDNIKNSEVNIFDMSGRELHHTALHSGYNAVALPKMPSGIYMLRIKNDKLNIVKRLQIQ